MKSILSLLLLSLFSLNLMAAPAATHGMVIFGKDQLFAYHLPMFHKIHNKQMVLTFDISAKLKQTISKLQDSEFLTFVPAPFDLDQFIAKPFELTGDLFQGHFEKEGKVVMEGITLLNPKIIYLKDLIRSNGKIEEYKLFGNKNDIYALHLVDGGIAKDQIVKLKNTPDSQSNLDYIIKFLTLKNTLLLQIDHEYTIMTAVPGRCPSRLCGSTINAETSFKADSIYFEDEVM